MAFKTFVDAVTLPASDINTYLMKQAVIVCTSGTRPSSPIEGETIYETDTDKLLIYTTATTGWVPPWNLAWGTIGMASVTADQTTVGPATTDLTGLTVTFTAVANRRYRAMLHVNYDTTVANDVATADLIQGATVVSYGQVRLGASGTQETLSLLCFFSASSGSLTVKAQGGRAAGTGQIALRATSTNPSYLMVEDIGPSAAPA